MNGRPRVAVTRPASQRYQDLVDSLSEVCECLDAGADSLEMAWTSLAKVTKFLDADPAVMQAGLTRPLHRLASALSDRMKGARPALLFDRRKPRPGRPNETSFEAAKGAIVSAVDVVMGSGDTGPEARKFIVLELERLGIRAPGGKPITEEQVRHWREQADARHGDRRMDAVLRGHKRRQAQVAQLMPQGKEGCRRFAIDCLRAVKAMGF